MKQYLLLLTLVLISVFASAQSQWNTDTLVRNPICTAVNLQYEPLMCSDGQKGAIITWVDQRVTNAQQIYAQRIDSNGVTKWTTDGVLINPPSNSTGVDDPLIVTDGSGGAIIFYNSTVGGVDYIYAQRLDPNGNALWGSTGGVPVSIAQDSRIRSNETSVNNNAASDGAGGAYITWQGYVPLNNYAQHIDKNGNAAWAVNGISITNTDSIGVGYESFIVNTGAGTAAVGYTYDSRLYLQRVAANGSLMWGTGVLIADSVANDALPVTYLAFDSVSTPNSIMLSWVDMRNNTNALEDIYGQKIALNGSAVWQYKGVPIATSASNEYEPDLLIDKSGGFFVTYDSAGNTRVQHVNSNGQLVWGATGKATNVGNYVQEYPVIADDGNGSIISMWHDQRNSGDAIYAQHFDISGTTQWSPDGIPVIVGSPDIDHSVNPILSLEDGTAIAVWSDFRIGIAGNDIYAAKFGGPDGLLPVQLLSFTAALVNGEAQLHWSTAEEINNKYFDVERSEDGKNFLKLTTVQGQASDVAATYSTIDPSPFNGYTYYRLKQVALNGSFSYSNIASVKKEILLSLYPNPVKKILHIDGLNTGATTLSVIDFTGRILQRTATNGNSAAIDMQQLPAGSYFLKIQNGSDVNTMKFVKQ